MEWHITVGAYRLGLLASVEIKRSVEMLADTATITLPATAYNRALEVESKIKRGDPVSVQLGYNGDLVAEFEGFLESITTDGGVLKLACEDALFMYRKEIPDAELVNPDVKQVLDYVNKHVDASLTLSCDYAFRYDKFVIHNATGFDVLKKIQEEAKPNIYLKGKTLHVHPQYVEQFGVAAYDFSKNVEQHDLKYRDKSERKVLVEVEYTDAKGKTGKITAGTTGGDRVTLKAGTADPASLKLLANEELSRRVFTGFEGSFTGWLIPFCDAGFSASLRDADYPYKDGTYYVTAVEVSFSESGGKRKIYLGKKLK